MYISPVNNINFNGSFKKTRELERLLQYSDKNTLFRFNEVLERAGKVNDKKIFKISALAESRLESWGKITSFHFHLLSFPEHNEYHTIMEDMKSFEHNHSSDKENLLDKYSSVLKSFVPTLEKMYPKTDFKESNDELIQKINDKLV